MGISSVIISCPIRLTGPGGIPGGGCSLSELSIDKTLIADWGLYVGFVEDSRFGMKWIKKRFTRT